MLISLLIDNNELVFVEKDKGYGEINNIGSMTLPKNVISKGKIVNANLYDEAIKTIKDNNDFESRKVRLIIKNNIVKLVRINSKDAVDYNLDDSKERNDFIEKYLLKISKITDLNEKTYVYHRNEDFINVFLIENEILNSYITPLVNNGFDVDSTDLITLSAIKEEAFLSANESRNIITCNALISSDNISLSIVEKNNIVNLFYLPLNEEMIKNYEVVLQDEIYRLCNYYCWNLNDGKKRVERVIIYPMFKEYKTITDKVINNNLTGVSNVIVKDENNSIYPVECKYNLVLAETMIDYDSENLFVNFIERQESKQEISEPLVYISTFFLCLALFLTLVYMPYQRNVDRLDKLNTDYDLVSSRLQSLEQANITDYVEDENNDVDYDIWKDDYLSKLEASKYYKTDLTHIIQELSSIKVDGVLVSKLDYSNDGTVAIELIASKEAAYVDYLNTIDYNLKPFAMVGEYHEDISKITFNFYHELNTDTGGDEDAAN